MFTKVLVPLDGSELAEGILPYLSQLAKGLDIPLALLSVIDPDAIELPEHLRIRDQEGQANYPPETMGQARPAPPAPAAEQQPPYPHETGGPYASQVFESVESEVKRRLEEVVKRLASEDVRAGSVVAFGHAAEEIVRVAEREHCDLVAMSTHGRGVLARGILGSVTDKVIHSSHLPTLTITPERAEQYWQHGVSISKIMVPLDGSQLAESALPYAEYLAQKLSLEVVLVRAVQIGGVYVGYANGYPYAGSADLEAEIEQEVIEYLKGVTQRLRDKGLTVQWKLLRGHPSASIVDLAQETPQDMIALATHGRSGVSRWILGSVAEAVIRSSGDPVLVIPPKQTVHNPKE